MRRAGPRPLALAALAVAALALPALLPSATAQDGAADAGSSQGPLPPGPHVDLVYAKCQTCHNLRYVTDSIGMPAFLWEDTVSLMERLGMQVTDEERAQLIEYLTTYLGPEGPPAPAEAGPDAAAATDGSSADGTTGETDASSAEAPADHDGGALYLANCAGCHGADGQGLPGVFPPLAGHVPALVAADRGYLPLVLLHGLQGEITVRGERYDGVMPAWAQLSDGEIAALLDHVLRAWGNDALLPEDAAPYAPEDVAAARDRDLTPREVRERRPQIGDE